MNWHFNKRHLSGKDEQAMTLMEIIIAAAIMSATVAVIMILFNNHKTAEMAVLARAEAYSYVGQQAYFIKRNINNRKPGKIFHCTKNEIAGDDAYCLANCLNSINTSADPDGQVFQGCLQLVVFQGRSEDPGTNPKRVEVTTQCEPVQPQAFVVTQYEESKCGLKCGNGSRPVTTITVSSGASSKSNYLPHPSSVDKIVGFETCFNRTSNSSIISANMQTYFRDGIKTVGKVDFSLITSGVPDNDNLLMIPQ